MLFPLLPSCCSLLMQGASSAWTRSVSVTTEFYTESEKGGSTATLWDWSINLLHLISSWSSLQNICKQRKWCNHRFNFLQLPHMHTREGRVIILSFQSEITSWRCSNPELLPTVLLYVRLKRMTALSDNNIYILSCALPKTRCTKPQWEKISEQN